MASSMPALRKTTVMMCPAVEYTASVKPTLTSSRVKSLMSFTPLGFPFRTTMTGVSVASA